MNRRLILEVPDRVPDGAGGFNQTWVSRGHVWGAVETRGAGRDVDLAARLRLKITVRATQHGGEARPNATMRFRDGARIYLIEAVHETDPRGRTLTCFAFEEVGQ